MKLADGLGAKSLAELRAKPAEVILKAGRGRGAGGGRIADSRGSREGLRRGQADRSAGADGIEPRRIFRRQPAQSAAEFMEQARKRFGDLADAFLKLYPADFRRTGARIGVLFGPRRNGVRDAELGAAGRQTWQVQSRSFTISPSSRRACRTRRGPFAPGPHGSATHVSEILYVFSHLDGSRTWTDADRQVADAMSSYWVNFATNGDPNGKGLPKWPVYDEKTKTPWCSAISPKARRLRARPSWRSFSRTSTN